MMHGRPALRYDGQYQRKLGPTRCRSRGHRWTDRDRAESFVAAGRSLSRESLHVHGFYRETETVSDIQ